MAKLQLGIAVGDYDRMRPLVDGTVQIDGVDPQWMLLDPEDAPGGSQTIVVPLIGVGSVTREI